MVSQWECPTGLNMQTSTAPDSSPHVITVPQTCPKSCSTTKENKGTVTIKDGRGVVSIEDKNFITDR